MPMLRTATLGPVAPLGSAVLTGPVIPPRAVAPGATPLASHVDPQQLLADLHDIDGPRVAGTPGLLAAARKMQAKLDAIGGWKTSIEQYASRTWMGNITLYDVVAERDGTGDATSRGLVVAGAHLDTVTSAPGGNDDGTGSVALLALARSLKDSRATNDVKLVWFDGEEIGLKGSAAYVQAHSGEMRRTVAMVEAEMLGSPSGAPVLLYAGRTDAKAGAAFVDGAKAQGLPLEVPAERPYGSDHNAFGDVSVPSMCLSSTAPIGRDPEGRIHHDDPAYHSSRDTIDHLNVPEFARLTDLFVSGVTALADQVGRAS